MKTFSLFKTSSRLVMVLLLISILFVQMGCKKNSDPSTNLPTKFTELNVNPSFQFDNYINLNATIGIGNSGAQLLSLIQIYQNDPKSGGKLISSGATDANGQYKTTLRVPSRLKELWVGKISQDGNNEYIAVPISGTNLTYIFGQSTNKSTESNDCNTGTPIANNGNYTVNSGQVYVVKPGVSLSNISLTINANGTVRICGSANITGLSGTGKLIISPSGYVTLPLGHTYGTIENYGTANFAQSGNNKKFQIDDNATVHNWGIITMSNGLKVKGTFINEYHVTVVEQTETEDDGRIINYCQFFINSTSSEAFKITTGSSANPGFVNNANAFLKVNGHTIVSGQGYVSLGLQSLIETGTFKITGFVAGPSAQGAQVHALGSTKSEISGANLSGYTDFWATSINPKNGTIGTHITWHNPGYTIIAQDCSAPVAPIITSSLQGAGMVGQPITPYIITATGTNPITYSAANLPSGLTYNPTTHTISGTPATAGQFSITLVADNLMGTDTRILSFQVINAGTPPAINSDLILSTTVNQQFSYTITAVGSTPITFNATNLPAGLSFNPTTSEIYGMPTSVGVFNIPLSATNNYGSDNNTLVLTVGAPPVITSALTASGTTGQQFLTYTVTATGSGTMAYNATNLPGGLTFSDVPHSINGTPSQAAVVNVTLTASNEFGTDSKILVITIVDPVVSPLITSLLTTTCMVNQPFTYTITATGTQPIVFNATNLPAGLTYDPVYGVISGIPSSAGTTNVTLTATNSAGTDTKTLVLTCINLSPPIVDTDGDGVSDPLDAYPTDATRAFNSYYPNEVDYATYAFEDLWPAYGDYDCNDLTITFRYQIVTNSQNKVVDLITQFKVKSSGASFDNGFGISLNTAPSNVESVTGCIKVGNVVNLDPKGYEAGHTTNTVIIPVDAVNTLLGRSIINTVHGGYTVQTEFQTVHVHLSTPQTSIGTAPFNPFIFIDQDRGKEVHLKDNPPTQLANPVYFGSMNDASNPGLGQYYRSTTGLPWGLEIPVDFDYPIEKADIVQTYVHFAQWAQSSGTEYPDWYMDKPGYRVVPNVY
jgi:LruC domain-containing protein